MTWPMSGPLTTLVPWQRILSCMPMDHYSNFKPKFRFSLLQNIFPTLPFQSLSAFYSAYICTGLACPIDSVVLWKGPYLGHFSANLAHKRLTVNAWKYKALYLLPRNYSYMPCMGFSYFPWSPGHHLCWISKSIKAVPDGCLEVFNHG